MVRDTKEKAAYKAAILVISELVCGGQHEIVVSDWYISDLGCKAICVDCEDAELHMQFPYEY
jgi:hypothetical protein